MQKLTMQGKKIIRVHKSISKLSVEKHLATEKLAPHYASCVPKGYAFSDKDLYTPLSAGKVDMF